MKKVDKYVRFLVDNGLLFEINRKVLHPLGYALDIDIHPDNSKWLSINGLLEVDDDDEEGFVYDDEAFDVGSEKYELFLAKKGQKKLNLRKDKLGFIIQEKKS